MFCNDHRCLVMLMNGCLRFLQKWQNNTPRYYFFSMGSISMIVIHRRQVQLGNFTEQGLRYLNPVAVGHGSEETIQWRFGGCSQNITKLHILFQQTAKHWKSCCAKGTSPWFAANDNWNQLYVGETRTNLGIIQDKKFVFCETAP